MEIFNKYVIYAVWVKTCVQYIQQMRCMENEYRKDITAYWRKIQSDKEVTGVITLAQRFIYLSVLLCGECGLWEFCKRVWECQNNCIEVNISKECVCVFKRQGGCCRVWNICCQQLIGSTSSSSVWSSEAFLEKCSCLILTPKTHFV